MISDQQPVAAAGAGDPNGPRQPGGSRGSVPAISLRDIRKAFGSHQALRGVDLDLYPGECLGLVGDNAAGKSTLTKVISGTYIPDDGTIAINGDVVRLSGPADARNRHIEMVFQDLSLCDHVDVVGNLFLGRELTKGPFLDHSRMIAEARKMLDALEQGESVIRVQNFSRASSRRKDFFSDATTQLKAWYRCFSALA